MSNARHRFRRDMGVTEMQYRMLVDMQNGEIRRDQLLSLQSIHVLAGRGIVEYVASTTGKQSDDVWRLTAHGRMLLHSWS